MLSVWALCKPLHQIATTLSHLMLLLSSIVVGKGIIMGSLQPDEDGEGMVAEAGGNWTVGSGRHQWEC